jgi:purine-binding chemotaxis protein CheW
MNEINQLQDGARRPRASVKASASEYLAFVIGAEQYAIDIRDVQEIRSYSHVTHIANAPEHIRGIVNLRGVVVPILDLRIRFRMS